MEQIQKNGKLAIVTGATGRTGYHVVVNLIKKGYTVRIITRNHESAKKLFKEYFNQMETPVICNLAQEAQALEKKLANNTLQDSLLDLAFSKGSENEEPTLLVCCSSKSQGSSEKCKYIEYIAVKLLVELSKKHNIKKFVLISALSIQRPYRVITQILNRLVDEVYYWKAQAENYVRNSGLDYIIQRPGGLKGDQNKFTLDQVTMSQGDVVSGMISRASVAQNLIDVLSDSNTPNKVTYEAVTLKSQRGQTYKYEPISLKQDTKNNIINPQIHRTSRRNINLVFYTVILGVSAYLFRGYLPILNQNQ